MTPASPDSILGAADTKTSLGYKQQLLENPSAGSDDAQQMQQSVRGLKTEI